MSVPALRAAFLAQIKHQDPRKYRRLVDAANPDSVKDLSWDTNIVLLAALN